MNKLFLNLFKAFYLLGGAFALLLPWILPDDMENICKIRLLFKMAISFGLGTFVVRINYF